MRAAHNLCLPALAGSTVCLLVATLIELTLAAPASSLEAQASWPVASPMIGELERATRDASDKKKEKSKEKSKARDKKAARECLAVHNRYRKKHGVPELKWDDKIAEFAQKRSEHIAKSDGAEFGHPPDLPFGENLFWHSSSDTACELMVKGWYDEINLYDFRVPTFAPATGHFTQLIWRQTERVGCALAHSSGKRGGVYLTCNYDPAGNFVGEFEANVPAEMGALASVARGGAAAGNLSTSTTPRPSTALVASTSSTTSTTSSPAPTSKAKKKGKGKKKSKNKNKNKKNKSKNKNKNKRKGNRKKNKKNSTTSTTSTSRPATR